MSNRIGRLILGSSYLLLAGTVLVGLAAPRAQAASWMVNGTNVTSNLSVSVTSEIEALFIFGLKKHLVLLTTVGSVPVSILCGEMKITNTTLESGGKAKFTYSFGSCKSIEAKSGEEEKEFPPVCQPKEPITGTATAETAKHGGVTYLKITGVGGKFEAIEIGEECAFEALQATGTLWLRDCKNSIEVEATTHLLDEAGTPTVLGGLFINGKSATVDGSANFSISDGGSVKYSLLG